MMDAASRSLIERAAAHLQRRNETAQAAMPLAANGDWGGTAAPIHTARARAGRSRGAGPAAVAPPGSSARSRGP